MSFSVLGWSIARASLLAAGPPSAPWMSPARYYTGLAILSVLMMIAAVKAYRAWEEINDVEEPDSPKDLLQTFEAAYADGEIDAEELARVRARLAQQSAGHVPDLGAKPDDLSQKDPISDEMSS